jgi:pimeloyl-ACP methyl ester carboxylesterase
MKKLLIRSIGQYLNLLALVTPATAADRAFALFCRPFRSKINPKQLAFFNSAETVTVDADGYPVRVHTWGNGSKNVLFLHGWQSHSYRWKAYIDSLPKDEYTITAIDAPGHGLSEGNFLTVPVYSNVIQEMIHRLGNVDAIVSHSLGSFTLLYTIHKFPLLPVGKLIVMGTPGEAEDFVHVFRTTLGVSDRVIRLIENKFVELYDVKPEYFSLSRFAPALTQHGLIIHDKEDSEAPFTHATTLHKVWKKSQFIATEKLGHNLKSPDIVRLVTSYIQGQPIDSEVTFKPESVSM